MGTNCKFEFCSVIGNCIVLVLNFLMHFHGSIYVSNIDHSSHFLMKFFSFCNVIDNFLVSSLNFLMPPYDSIYVSNINHNSNFLIKFSFCSVNANYLVHAPQIFLMFLYVSIDVLKHG
jgi:hypothetical protein